MNRKYVAVISALCIAAGASAWPGTSQRESRSLAPIPADGVKKVLIHAGPGKLVVHGTQEGAIVVTGDARADSKADLDKLQLTSKRDGDTLVIESATQSSWQWWGGRKAWLDTDVAVPGGMAVEIHDGSGDLEVRGTGETRIADGSGDIDLTDIHGDVEVNDDSGDIRAAGVQGSVNIPRDGSGEVKVDDTQGDVRIDDDGSGDIQITQVRRSVYIGSDGSGEIQIANVLGSVNINADGSGGIDVRDVAGDLRVGADGSGGIHHERIGGSVHLPH